MEIGMDVGEEKRSYLVVESFASIIANCICFLDNISNGLDEFEQFSISRFLAGYTGLDNNLQEFETLFSKSTLEGTEKGR